MALRITPAATMADKESSLRIPNILEQAEALTAAKQAKQKEEYNKKKRIKRKQKEIAFAAAVEVKMSSPSTPSTPTSMRTLESAVNKMAERRQARTLMLAQATKDVCESNQKNLQILQKKIEEDDKKEEEEFQALVALASKKMSASEDSD